MVEIESSKMATTVCPCSNTRICHRAITTEANQETTSGISGMTMKGVNLTEQQMCLVAVCLDYFGGILAVDVRKFLCWTPPSSTPMLDESLTLTEEEEPWRPAPIMSLAEQVSIGGLISFSEHNATLVSLTNSTCPKCGGQSREGYSKWFGNVFRQSEQQCVRFAGSKQLNPGNTAILLVRFRRGSDQSRCFRA